MKPIFTKIIAIAETTEQTAAATKIVLDNIQYLDKIEFIKHSGYIMVSITIKNKIYKIKSYKKEWREIIKYLDQHNWLDYVFENSIQFCNPEKYTL